MGEQEEGKGSKQREVENSGAVVQIIQKNQMKERHK
jgi:hypothetical protein